TAPNVAAAVVVPPDVPGKDDAERVRNYAATMTRMVADAFPTEVIAHRFQKDTTPQRSDLKTFFGNILKQDTGFQVRQSAIEKFVADNPAAVDGVAHPATLVSQLKAVQRVSRLTPQAEYTKPLLDLHLHSASAITRLGASAFVAKVDGHLDSAT